MFEFLKDKKGEPPALPEGTVRRRYSIEGQVQGVGVRPFVFALARECGLWCGARREFE